MYSKFFHENTDGVTQEWDFSFAGGYLSRDHVKVLFWPTGEFIGVPQEPAFTFLNDTRVRVTPAVPAGGTLEIRRVTPITQALVEFNDTSDFVEDNLNVMAQQAIYAVAELVDLYQDPNLTPTGVRSLLMTGLLDNPLGVGTITPAAKLEIVHTAGQVLNVTTSTDTDADIVVNRNSVESGRVRGVLNGLHVMGTSFVSLLANGIETLRVASTGALINGKLTVNRGAGADAIEVQTNAGQDGYIDFRRGAGIVASLRSAFYGLALNASQVIAFLIDGVERIRIDAAGRLGIGTNNPTANLHVSPATGSAIVRVQASSGNVAQLALNVGGVGEQTITGNVGSSQNIAFNVAGAEQMRIVSGGVGVGTTSPAAAIHIQRTSANANLQVESTTSNQAGINLYNSVRQWRIVSDPASSGVLQFFDQTAGSERMRISATGLVGVGTTNPQRGLHLAGGEGSAVPSVRLERTGVRTFSIETASAGELLINDNTAGAARLYIQGDGVVTVPSGRIGVDTLDGADTKRLQLSGSNFPGITRGAYINLHGNEYSTSPGAVSILAGDVVGGVFSVFTGAGFERLRVTESGRVGVGTTSPRSEFDVNGAVTISDGNGPTLNLHRNVLLATGSAAGRINFGGRFDASNYASGACIIGATVGNWSSTNYGTQLEFYTAAANSTTLTERMRLTASGLLGIGTSTPVVRLDVNGDINASSSINIGFNRTADGSAVFDLQAQAGTGIDYNARLQRATGVDGNLTLTNAGNGSLVLQTEGNGLVNIRQGNTSRVEVYSNSQVFLTPANTDNTTDLRTTTAGRQIAFNFTHGTPTIAASNYFGSAGAAGQLVADSGQYDMVSRTDGRSFRWSVNNGVSTAMRLNSQGALELASSTLRLSTSRTPASATAAGAQGDICWDANYIYVCVATNTWRRIAHATW